jgi:hypothetical protein
MNAHGEKLTLSKESLNPAHDHIVRPSHDKTNFEAFCESHQTSIVIHVDRTDVRNIIELTRPSITRYHEDMFDRRALDEFPGQAMFPRSFSNEEDVEPTRLHGKSNERLGIIRKGRGSR